MDNLFEITLRIIANYATQALWAVILSLILLWFYQIYKEKYLKYWSLSWGAFALYMFGAGIALLTSQKYPADSPIRILISAITIIGGYLQIAWLILGTIQLIYNKVISKKLHLWFILICVFVGLVSTILFVGDPDASRERLFLRVGIRSLVTGLGFLSMGSIILYKNLLKRSLGRLLVIVSFLLYGIEQIQYFISGFVISFVEAEVFVGFSIVSGYIDFLLQVTMGIGMIVWLLELERKKLVKTNKELDSFLYSTSHDLRAPIASILGLTNLAQKESRDRKANEHLSMIESRVEKLDEVINDILNYSKVSKRELKKEFIDFNQMISEAISNVKYNEKADEIELLYEPKKSNVLYSDRGQLEIIINNLIANAVKYHDLGKETPWIKIDFERKSGWVCISISDNGIGISRKNQDRIFDMFYRASDTSDGSGLGLYIAREAAERLGGSLEVDSTKNEGSTFKVKIPDSR